MTTHTSGDLLFDKGHITDKDGNLIAIVPYNLGDEQDIANGIRLVNCWNNFEKLLDVSKEAYRLLMQMNKEDWETAKRLKQAIEEQGGEL